MKKIYIIGDSISLQYGLYLEQNLAGIIEYTRKEGDDKAFLNLDNPQGSNGGDSSMVLRFLKEKKEINADYFLLNCGLHDIKNLPGTRDIQIPIDQYKENLKEILTVVAQMKPKLVWIRTTPCDEKVHNKEATSIHRYAEDCHEYNQAADEIMREADVPIIDLFSFTENLGDNLYFDHVHFHEHIREKQAAFIAGWLMRELQ